MSVQQIDMENGNQDPKSSQNNQKSSTKDTKNAEIENQAGKKQKSDSFIKKHQKKGTWVNAAQWMITDVIGAGVLGIGSGFVELGWVLGIFFLTIMLPLNIFTSILLSRLRSLYPQAHTMMDLANATMGKFAKKFTAFCVYTQIFLVMGDYLLLIGDVLGFSLFDIHYCKYIWSLIAIVLLTPLVQARSLTEISWLCWVNMFTILLSLGISLVYLLEQGVEVTRKGSYTEFISSNSSFLMIWGGISKFMFAYSGQFMYMEIMSEMKEPKDFPKAFYISGPFQYIVYLCTGVIGYYCLGQKASGDIIQAAIPFSPLLRVTGFILLVHMLISYLVKNTIMGRAIHTLIDAKNAHERTLKSKIQWFSITLTLLMACYILANLIPFFSQLTGLIGAAVLPFSAIIIPIFCYLSSCKTKSLKIPVWEYIVIIIALIFAFSLLFIGTYNNVLDILENWSTFGPPFSCICQDIWNTCSCSKDHLGMEYCNEII